MHWPFALLVGAVLAVVPGMQLPFVHTPDAQSLLHAQVAPTPCGVAFWQHFVPVPQALDEQSVLHEQALPRAAGVVLMHPAAGPAEVFEDEQLQSTAAVTATPANIRFHGVDHASMRLSLFAYNPRAYDARGSGSKRIGQGRPSLPAYPPIRAFAAVLRPRRAGEARAAGHFALETNVDDIAVAIDRFSRGG
jgi:hypothetical protein